MFSILLMHGTPTLVSCALMFWFGRRYASKPATGYRGAVLRALCWSILFCWTVLLIGGGMTPGIVPVPSWGALVFWLMQANPGLGFETDLGAGISAYFIPHVLLSPGLPVVAYLLAYRLRKRRVD